MKKKDLAVDKYLKGIIFGKPGSTKTRTAGGLEGDPRTGPCLYLDCMGNSESMRDYENIPDILQIDRIDDLTAVYDFLAKGQPDNHPLVVKGYLPGGKKYQGVVIDTITDIQRQSVEKVTDNVGLGVGEIPKATKIQDWGSVLMQMQAIAKAFFSLRMHVLMIGQQDDDRNEETGAITYKILLQGKSAEHLPAYALFVMRLAHKTKYDPQTLRLMPDIDKIPATAVIGLLQPLGRNEVKDQQGFRVPFIVDPTITKMLDILKW